ncbi:MAG: hypothetical protein KQH63_02135 [Desulfobulbaceae bacterium]|nr:hypothetical protein [Desulfobulbaceae bacterium]
MRTCVSPNGSFQYTIHNPAYEVKNLRENDNTTMLGLCNGQDYRNTKNYPEGDITVESADRIYEIPNALPFKGSTFINSRWADQTAKNPLSIGLPEPKETSFSQNIAKLFPDDTTQLDDIFSALPEAVLLALATTSSDPADLVRLAALSCEFHLGQDGTPQGLLYEKDSSGNVRAKISNHPLFEAVGNNPHLPSPYKQAMVLRPGAQGGSEIIGEWNEADHHVFEYLRRNSYIPWGHYASNMANDAVRYHIRNLSHSDMCGLRHLYYQRTYVRLAAQLGISVPHTRQTLLPSQLEELREKIQEKLNTDQDAGFFDCTMWGWNYGFDFAPSHYRLNASHQQIHQQFAMLPSSLPIWQHGQQTEKTTTPFACGQLVADCIRTYEKENGRSFFADYIANIRKNQRMDGTDGESSLIVYEDEHVMLFVPKAQTSQWELQLMTVNNVGNIIEADQPTRSSLDFGMHTAMQVLGGLGVKMVTTIEYSKRFIEDIDQPLIYTFLPKLPKSPGAFSEAQLRWIMGHFPEDFALACRNQLS